MLCMIPANGWRWLGRKDFVQVALGTVYTAWTGTDKGVLWRVLIPTSDILFTMRRRSVAAALFSSILQSAFRIL
jgi:hypothetical protein